MFVVLMNVQGIWMTANNQETGEPHTYNTLDDAMLALERARKNGPAYLSVVLRA